MTLRTFFFLSNKLFFQVKTATEGYVNNTGKNLGTMEGQVEGLTDRMVDVDSNLNYMLGQLSLVVQEFNQVRTIPLWRWIDNKWFFLNLGQNWVRWGYVWFGRRTGRDKGIQTRRRFWRVELCFKLFSSYMYKKYTVHTH